MKRYLFSYICTLFACWQAYAVEPQWFYHDVDYTYGAEFNCTEVYVEEGAIISALGDDIPMTTAVYLYNSGTINGTINTNDYNLFVYNSGEIPGGITNIGGGNVTQVIRSGAELTDIDVGPNNKTIRIDGYQNVSLQDIMGLNATSFIIKESSVVMDDFSDWQNWDANVIFDGVNKLIVNDVDSVVSGVFINHALAGDEVSVEIPDLDKMYKTERVVEGSGIVLNIVRETNYNVVLSGNSSGSALELIRVRKPNDRFLRALDVADNMDEINRLKKRSYRFNHDILARPIKMTDEFSVMNIMKNEKDSGVGITPYYVFSDNINTVGARVYAGYEYDNLYFNAGFSFNKFDYSDYLNEFTGWSYGLDLTSRQTFSKFWLNETFGLTLTDYKAEYISTDGNLKTNPLGLSWFADMASGYDFEINSDVNLSPIIGVAYEHYDVADVSDIDSYLHGGMNVKYSFVVDGIKYEYSLSGGIATNSNIFATMQIGFVSVTDNAGVSIDANVLKNDFDYYYKFALTGKILF